MASAQSTSPEQPILRACARGELSRTAAFEQLYELYAPVVRGWLAASAAADADDLFQDVWIVFYERWRSWLFRPDMEAPEARPVISFLYRTLQFVLKAKRRRAENHEPLGSDETAAVTGGSDDLHRRIEFGRCLDLARSICPPEEMNVLLAKLAGIPAREIARTLSVTEPVVDHRYRSAIDRLKKRLKSGVLN